MPLMCKLIRIFMYTYFFISESAKVFIVLYTPVFVLNQVLGLADKDKRLQKLNLEISSSACPRFFTSVICW